VKIEPRMSRIDPHRWSLEIIRVQIYVCVYVCVYVCMCIEYIGVVGVVSQYMVYMVYMVYNCVYYCMLYVYIHVTYKHTNIQLPERHLPSAVRLHAFQYVCVCVYVVEE
jgi:hypothetical protein